MKVKGQAVDARRFVREFKKEYGDQIEGSAEGEDGRRCAGCFAGMDGRGASVPVERQGRMLAFHRR